MSAPSSDVAPAWLRQGLGALGLVLWVGMLLSPAVGEAGQRGVVLVVGVALALGALAGGGPLARSDLGRRLAAWAELDLGRGTPGLIFGAVYLAFRIPLLSKGYGADPDAWRVAASGLKLMEAGTYEVSRFPGYPLIEIGLSPLVALGGPVVVNGATALAGLAGVWFFDRLGRKLGFRAMALASVAFAFAPLYVVNTANLMDYAWAVAGMLGGAWLATEARWLPAAGALGLSVLARPTMAVQILPLAAWIVFALRPPKAELGKALGLFFGVCVAGFAPVILRYGARFFSHTEPEVTLASASTYALGAFGVAMLAAGGAALADALRGEGEPVRPAAGSDAANLGMLAGLAVVCLGLFAWLPIQSGYLLPLIPVGLLLAARLSHPASLAVLAVAALLGTLGDTGFGSVRREAAAREKQVLTYQALRAVDVPDGAIVMVSGGDAAILDVLGEDLIWRPDPPWARSLLDEAHDRLYTARLDSKGMERAKREGRLVFLSNKALDPWTKDHYNYSPVERGAVVLDLKVSDDPLMKKSAGKKEDPLKKRAAKGDDTDAGDGKKKKKKDEASGDDTAGEAEAPGPAKGDDGDIDPTELDRPSAWLLDEADREAKAVVFADGRTRLLPERRPGEEIRVCQADGLVVTSRAKAIGKVRLRGVKGGGLRVWVNWTDKAGAAAGEEEVVAVKADTDGWQTLKTFHAPPSKGARAKICAAAKASEGEIIVDDLQLMKVK